jgi:hypothetical protein
MYVRSYGSVPPPGGYTSRATAHMLIEKFPQSLFGDERNHEKSRGLQSLKIQTVGVDELTRDRVQEYDQEFGRYVVGSSRGYREYSP